MYLICRQQQLFTIEKSKGKNKVLRIVVPWTTGFVLPEPGGMLDQPHRMIEFFALFMAADRKATNERLNSTT